MIYFTDLDFLPFSEEKNYKYRPHTSDGLEMSLDLVLAELSSCGFIGKEALP
jgi:hypothetical protein